MKKSGRHQRRQRARRRALQALYQWQITRQDAGEILRQFQAAQDLGEVDADYFAALLQGVIREQAELDERLGPFLDRPMQHVDAIEQAVLRLGAWELLHAEDVPLRVILDEAIDLAHRFGAEQGHAFINGVLDKAARSWRAAEAD
jgi:transcription antitermination protein NusB